MKRFFISIGVIWAVNLFLTISLNVDTPFGSVGLLLDTVLPALAGIVLVSWVVTHFVRKHW